MPAQNLECPAAVSRVGIGCSDNEELDSRRSDRIGAWRSPSMRAARFECDVKCCSPQRKAALFGITDRLDFCVGLAGAVVPALANDFPSLDQYRPDHWIGRSQTVTAAGQPQSTAHQN